MTDQTQRLQVAPVQTRVKCSGIILLTQLAYQDFVGEDSGQERRQFILTSLTPNPYWLYVCSTDANSTAGVICFGQSSITLETNSDLRVHNPNSHDVSFMVMELFYDDGNRSHGAPGGKGKLLRPH